jgi:hypothetical protein
MAITTQETVVLAEVEVTDEYRVELRQHRKGVSHTPEDARQLGTELIRAAWDAEQALFQDNARHAAAAAAESVPLVIDGEVVA